jgi:curli biogenesis system outer membrane secretion channel CsgG
MSRRWVEWFGAVAAAVVSGCAAPPPYLLDSDALAGVRRVAVLPFTGGPDYKGARPGDALAGAVTDQLPKDWSLIEVIERSEIDKVLDQSKLEAVGLTEAAGARELGEKLGVQAVILGDTLQYSEHRGDCNAGAAIRIVEVKTGRVIYSNTAHKYSKDSLSAAIGELSGELIRPLVAGLKARKEGGKP